MARAQQQNSSLHYDSISSILVSRGSFFKHHNIVSKEYSKQRYDGKSFITFFAEGHKIVEMSMRNSYFTFLMRDVIKWTGHFGIIQMTNLIFRKCSHVVLHLYKGWRNSLDRFCNSQGSEWDDEYLICCHWIWW